MTRFPATTLFRRLAATLGVLLAFSLSGWAQESASAKESNKDEGALVYAGEPMKVRLECDYDTLLKAGLVCSEDVPCDLLIELFGIAGTKTSVFVIGNVYTQEATVSTLVLASQDGGKTWTEAAKRIAAASVDSLQFADEEHGWISAQERDIDSSTKPFFFITQNGGKYWDRRNIWPNNDDRSGVIVEYYFETPQHGFVVIERSSSSDDAYELHETRNGGRSWSPREITGERPSIRRRLSAGAVQPEWRLTPNRQDEVYDVERRQGSSWEKVASFANEVGICLGKEAEQEKEQAEKLLTQQDEGAPAADKPKEEEAPVVQDGVLVVPGAR